MKTSFILFSNLLSLAATATALPAEQAIDTGVRPQEIVWIILYSEPNFGGSDEDKQVLELSEDSCRACFPPRSPQCQLMRI